MITVYSKAGLTREINQFGPGSTGLIRIFRSMDYCPTTPLYMDLTMNGKDDYWVRVNIGEFGKCLFWGRELTLAELKQKIKQYVWDGK